MRKIGLTLAAVAALATTAVVNSPAEAAAGATPQSASAWPQAFSARRRQPTLTTTVTPMAQGTAITMVDRMGIMTMARGTTAGTIATTTAGKEEPGAIRAFSLPG
jgi:hypothetical protein